jgi:predicted membrane channel-forming protein YqfA (hemolysin III family)
MPKSRGLNRPLRTASLSNEQLLEMFRHWDTRVSHHETVYVAISLAPMGLMIAGWKDAVPESVLVAAIASIAAFSFFLYSVRRFGDFQDRIFAILNRRTGGEWKYLNGYRGLTVRKLRFFGLFVLGLLWTLTLGQSLLKAHSKLACVPHAWIIALAACALVPTIIAVWLSHDLEKAKALAAAGDG